MTESTTKIAYYRGYCTTVRQRISASFTDDNNSMGDDFSYPSSMSIECPVPRCALYHDVFRVDTAYVASHPEEFTPPSDAQAYPVSVASESRKRITPIADVSSTGEHQHYVGYCELANGILGMTAIPDDEAFLRFPHRMLQDCPAEGCQRAHMLLPITDDQFEQLRDALNAKASTQEIMTIVGEPLARLIKDHAYPDPRNN